jgi:hypothetical protein
MKQVICALCLIVLISIGVYIYVTPPLKEWLGDGKDNYKNISTLIAIFLAATPLAHIVMGITRLFFPDKKETSRHLI